MQFGLQTLPDIDIARWLDAAPTGDRTLLEDSMQHACAINAMRAEFLDLAEAFLASHGNRQKEVGAGDIYQIIARESTRSDMLCFGKDPASAGIILFRNIQTVCLDTESLDPAAPSASLNNIDARHIFRDIKGRRFFWRSTPGTQFWSIDRFEGDGAFEVPVELCIPHDQRKNGLLEDLLLSLTTFELMGRSPGHIEVIDGLHCQHTIHRNALVSDWERFRPAVSMMLDWGKALRAERRF